MNQRMYSNDFYNPRLHQYKNQERYATFTVLPSHELNFEKPEDGIYLAYVYLAKRQPLLAMDALLKARQSISTLSVEQLQWLQRIMFDLPAKIGVGFDRDYMIRLISKADISSPEFTAVRTLAASILVDQKLKQPPLIIPDKLSKPVETRSRILEVEYEEQSLKKLKEFWNDKQFYQQITPIYADYSRSLKYVPDGMRLDDGNEHNLLRQIMRHSDDKDVPAHFKSRRRELSTRNILIEINQLNLLKATNPEEFPFVYQQRLDKLTKLINNNPKVIASNIEIQRINVALIPDKVISPEGPSDWALLRHDVSRRHAKFTPIIQLGANTSDADFLFSFKRYYQVSVLNATQGQKSDSFKRAMQERSHMSNALRHTLESVAIRRHEDPMAQLSLREQLSIILIYTLAYPDAFLRAAPVTPDEIQNALSVVIKLIAEGKTLQQAINLPVEEKKYLPVSIKPLPLAAPLKIAVPAAVDEASDDLLSSLRKGFAQEYKSNVDEVKEVKSELEFLHFSEEKYKKLEPIKQTLYEEIQKDYAAGVKQNSEIAQRNTVAKNICDFLRMPIPGRAIPKDGKPIESGITELSATIKTAIESKTLQTDALMQTILALANQPPPEGDAKRVIWDLQRAGQMQSSLDFTKIIHLFLTQDKNYYQQKTSLTDVDIDRLNHLIFDYLIKATAIQHDKRLKEEIDKLKNVNLSAENYDATVNRIGLLLDIKRCYAPEKDPEMLVFEYLDNKLIFKEQYQYIKDLLERKQGGLEFKSQAVQLIMGGGKSKVLLPLLALKKATGTNLSIIEVPDALFQLNKADLSATTKKIFGQQAHPFYFDDTIVCDIHHLRQIRNDLRKTIINREYLITTKESMQSFELKYLKFLKFMNEKDPEDIKTAQLFTEILSIFKYQGDVIIDEIDSTLDVRKQLIYTVGKGSKVPSHELKAVLDLHKFFDKVRLETEVNQDGIPLNPNLVGSTIEDIMLGKKTLASTDWPFIFKQLAQKLTQEEGSPLQDLITYVSADKSPEEVALIKNELITYLMGKSHDIPVWIKTLVPSDLKDAAKLEQLRAWQDKVAIYKEEISSILPLTLKKNMEEHFGLSQDLTKTEIDREIAIPFLASNTPSEKSKFGNYLETINYTLRIQLYKPLSKAVVKALVMHYKNQEEAERDDKYIKPAEYKNPALEFKRITGTELSTIDFDDIGTFNTFYQVIKDNKEVKEHCILNHVLNHVEKTSLILASDAQNHGSQFRSVQGMTGTDWNYRCYPTFVKTNKTVSMGSDGQTRDHLLKGAQKVLLLESAVNKDEKMAAMWKLFADHPKKDTLHAWIDLGAYFKGISNIDVANTLSQRFSETPESFAPIAFILFFFEDKLYALPKGMVATKANMIRLEQTDAEFIKAKLGVGPEQTFTYYDQRRITGTDIKQAANAHAFVPLGLKTIDRDELQAVMRLRELKNEQKIDFVVPKEVQDAYPEIKGSGDGPLQWNVKTIMKQSIDNQIERLCASGETGIKSKNI